MEEKHMDIAKEKGLRPGPCGLCTHDPACGFARADHRWLCHDDDHSCYRRWTVYGDRPNQKVVLRVGDTLDVYHPNGKFTIECVLRDKAEEELERVKEELAVVKTSNRQWQHDAEALDQELKQTKEELANCQAVSKMQLEAQQLLNDDRSRLQEELALLHRTVEALSKELETLTQGMADILEEREEHEPQLALMREVVEYAEHRRECAVWISQGNTCDCGFQETIAKFEAAEKERDG